MGRLIDVLQRTGQAKEKKVLSMLSTLSTQSDFPEIRTFSLFEVEHPV